MPLYGFVPDSPIIYYGNKIGRLARRSRGGGSGRPGIGGRGFTFGISKVTIFKPQLHKELNTPSGGLWKKLEERGDYAVKKAKAQVGVKTGKLRASIHKRHTGNFMGQYLWIGSKLNYAYMHHEGTKPHIIMPKLPYRPLRFSSKGRLVITPGPVFHPGTKPNPYLSNQLRYFVRL
jgi:hypothetical protein